MPNEQSSHSEAGAYVLRALQESARPLTVTELEKAVPKSTLKSRKDMQQLLGQMVKAGQVRSNKARSSVYWLPSLEDLASERVLEAFNDKPLTRTDLENKFRSLAPGWPPAKRKEMVTQLVLSGRIRSGNSAYWLPSLEDRAVAKILEALSEFPLAQKDLDDKLKGELSDWPQARRKEIFAQLLKEKRVYKVSPLTGKSSLLSVRAEATPQDYIMLALQLAVAKLKPRGLSAEQVLNAALEVLQPSAPSITSSPRHDADSLELLILERILQLNPSATTGATVQLSQLRQALHPEIADKDIFDQAIMRLAERGRVAAHRHDYIGSLSQEELAALVSDGRGNYFVAVTLRA